jgi:Tfp pilus assembly protein PilX
MRRSERGVALITVILMLLVLTVLGIAAALLMTQEDRTSARQEMFKAALYAAEVGLRTGERVLTLTPAAALSAILTYPSNFSSPFEEEWQDNPVTHAPRHPPCGPAANWNTVNLGTYLTQGAVGGSEIANVEVPIAAVSGTVDTGKRAFYSLYVRNNPEDIAVCTGGAGDTDGIVRLVSVGWVTNMDGVPLAVKVLEEEFNSSGISQAPSAQKQVNQGGTGQGIL